MTDTIRCPACRGAKKVPKLGGMIGECNTCSGKGTILAADKPKPVVMEETPEVNEVIKAVSECLPPSTITLELKSEPDIKIDGKRALYKRKKA
jgi:RecJ-like exonuclease